MKVDVGVLRRQTAFAKSDGKVILFSKDPVLRALISRIEIRAVYPDTVDEDGKWGSTFKIEVGTKPDDGGIE